MAALEHTHWWWCARRAIVARVLQAHLPPSPARRVLEVGCGTGGNLPMLARFGEVLGAEAAPEALRLHAAQGDTRFCVVRHAIPEPLEERFGLIAMLDVLEHIADDRGALAWLADHLGPGGH